MNELEKEKLFRYCKLLGIKEDELNEECLKFIRISLGFKFYKLKLILKDVFNKR